MTNILKLFISIIVIFVFIPASIITGAPQDANKDLPNKVKVTSPQTINSMIKPIAVISGKGLSESQLMSLYSPSQRIKAATPLSNQQKISIFKSAIPNLDTKKEFTKTKLRLSPRHPYVKYNGSLTFNYPTKIRVGGVYNYAIFDSGDTDKSSNNLFISFNIKDASKPVLLDFVATIGKSKAPSASTVNYNEYNIEFSSKNLNINRKIPTSPSDNPTHFPFIIEPESKGWYSISVGAGHYTEMIFHYFEVTSLE